MALPPQLEGHFGDIAVGHSVINTVQLADAGDIRHGLDIEHQYGIHKITFKNNYLYSIYV